MLIGYLSILSIVFLDSSSTTNSVSVAHKLIVSEVQ